MGPSLVRGSRLLRPPLFPCLCLLKPRLSHRPRHLRGRRWWQQVKEGLAWRTWIGTFLEPLGEKKLRELLCELELLLLLQLLTRWLQELNLLLQLPQAFRQARPLEGF